MTVPRQGVGNTGCCLRKSVPCSQRKTQQQQQQTTQHNICQNKHLFKTKWTWTKCCSISEYYRLSRSLCSLSHRSQTNATSILQPLAVYFMTTLHQLLLQPTTLRIYYHFIRNVHSRNLEYFWINFRNDFCHRDLSKIARSEKEQHHWWMSI